MCASEALKIFFLLLILFGIDFSVKNEDKVVFSINHFEWISKYQSAFYHSTLKLMNPFSASSEVAI